MRSIDIQYNKTMCIFKYIYNETLLTNQYTLLDSITQKVLKSIYKVFMTLSVPVQIYMINDNCSMSTSTLRSVE